MIICVVGKTSSGKDSVARIIKEKYNIDMVVSYTTAEKRKDQVEGVHHYFVTKEEMRNVLKCKNIIAYDKNSLGIEYCARVEDLSKPIVYVINPAGVEWLEKNGIDHKVIYVDCADKEILLRGSKRGDSLMKLTKRLSEESGYYNDFLNSKKWDYLIDNNGSFDMLVKQVSDIMNKLGLQG